MRLTIPRPRSVRPLVAIATIVTIAGCASARGTPPVDPHDQVQIGYDSQERSSITGSVGSVTAEDLAGQKVTRVEEMIEGRFAGVHVVRTANGLSLRIRGVSTFLGSTEPLIVIDGMPLHGGGNALVGINPNDIARIDILKDAGATAIYGSRGANGVVLITTKRAR